MASQGFSEGAGCIGGGWARARYGKSLHFLFSWVSDGGWGGGGRWGEEGGTVDRTTLLRDDIFWNREFKLSPEATRICHFNVLSSGTCLPEVKTPEGTTASVREQHVPSGCGPSAVVECLPGTSQSWEGCHVCSHWIPDGRARGAVLI